MNEFIPIKPFEEGNILNGTCFQETIEIAPVDLVKTFGNPSPADGYKISGEFAFKHRSGIGITLYDWKWTTLYDGENPYTPGEFWSLTKSMKLHIGAKNKAHVEDFKSWLKSEVMNSKFKQGDK